MSRTYYQPAIAGNHRRPIKLPKGLADYGRRRQDRRRGRRSFGMPKQ